MSSHKFAAVALPAGYVPAEDVFELEQRDGSVVKVQKMPGGGWSFAANDLPRTLTQLLFGLTAEQMLVLLRRNYPDFAAKPESEQTFHFVAVQRV